MAESVLTRRRRIVRRAVMALVVVATLIGIFQVHKRAVKLSEIQRSRNLRLGMTEIEVREVMGDEETLSWGRGPEFGRGLEVFMLIGESARHQYLLRTKITNFKILRRFRIHNPDVRSYDWTVRIDLDESFRVNRIQRGDEVEEAPKE